MRKLTYWLVGLALCGVALGAVLLLNNIREIPWEAAENAVCEATLTDAAGADINTAFRFTFAGDVSANAVRRYLTVEPAIELNYHQGLQGKEVLAVPLEPLQPGTLYSFSLATEADTLYWAFQTKQEWRAQSSVPAHAAAVVRLDAAVEIYFNQSLAVNLEALPDYARISPEVEGRFEQAGNCLRFIPAEPWAPHTVYTVLLGAGLPAADSSLLLAEDFTLAFETANADGSAPALPWLATAQVPSFLPGQIPAFTCYFYELAAPWAIPPSTNARAVAVAKEGELWPPIYATLYRYTDAAAYSEDLLALPPIWSFQGRYPQGADPQGLALISSQELMALQTDNSYSISWPAALDPGFYLLQATYQGQSCDIRFQVSSLTAFVQASSGESLVWAHQAQKGEVAAACQVTHANSGAQGQTDENGLLRLALTHELSQLDIQGAMLVKQDIYILRYGQEELVYTDYGTLGAAEAAVDGPDMWQYAALDQESYHSGDTLQFWGYMRRRDNTDWDWSRVSVYVCTADIPDEPVVQSYAPLNNNIFSGRLQLPSLLPGLYELQIWQSGQMLISKTFPVEATPIYMVNAGASPLRLTSTKEAYALQEEYTLSLEGAEGRPAPCLFIKSGGGLHEAVVEQQARHRSIFAAEDFGGAYWQAVIFDGQRYQITPYYSLAPEIMTHSLHVEAEAEDTIIRFTVKDAAGNAAAKAGLLALVAPPGRVLDDICGALYAGNRKSGIWGGPYQGNLNSPDMGAPTADKAYCFEALELDKNGQAELQLPDGLPPGAWQLYAWAVADAEQPLAGKLTMKLSAAKPRLCLDALSAYRVGDAPQIGLSWENIPASAQNQFLSYMLEVKGPLSISPLELTGGGAVNFSLPALPPGTYSLTATAQLDEAVYRAVHSFTVERPCFTQYQDMHYTAGGATTPAEAGWLFISGGTRVQSMDLLWQVLGGAQAGAEQRLAEAYARWLWQKYGSMELAWPDDAALPVLSSFQQTDGGLATWPEGPSELPLSMLAAALASEELDLFDAAALSRYLKGWAVGPCSVSERAMALAGLAALGQPVLPELKQLLKETGDLPYARACLIWGLACIGDVQVAKAALADLLAAYVADATAGSFYLEGGQGDNIYLNRVGALAAAYCGDAQTALALLQYLQNQQAADPLTMVLAADGLFKHSSATGAAITLVVDGQRQQLDMDGYGEIWLQLTAPAMIKLEEDSGSAAMICLSLTRAEIPTNTAVAAGLTLAREAQLLFNENNDKYLKIRVDYELEANMIAGDYTLCEYIPSVGNSEEAQLLSGQRYRFTGDALTITLNKKAGEALSGYVEYMLPLKGGGQAAFPPTVVCDPGGRLFTSFDAEVLLVE